MKRSTLNVAEDDKEPYGWTALKNGQGCNIKTNKRDRKPRTI